MFLFFNTPILMPKKYYEKKSFSPLWAAQFVIVSNISTEASSVWVCVLTISLILYISPSEYSSVADPDDAESAVIVSSDSALATSTSLGIVHSHHLL